MSPWLGAAGQAERWEGLANDFFLVSVSVGWSSPGGALKVPGQLCSGSVRSVCDSVPYG